MSLAKKLKKDFSEVDNWKINNNEFKKVLSEKYHVRDEPSRVNIVLRNKDLKE